MRHAGGEAGGVSEAIGAVFGAGEAALSAQNNTIPFNYKQLSKN